MGNEVATPSSGIAPLDLLARHSPRFAKLASTVAMGIFVHEYVNRTRRLVHARTEYTIRVESDDALYEPLLVALNPFLPRNNRATRARTFSNEGHVVAHDDSGSSSKQRAVKFVLGIADGSGQAAITIDGNKCAVVLECPERNSSNYRFARDAVVFKCHSAAARDAVKQFITDVATDALVERREPNLYVLGSWGDWDRRARDPYHPRPTDTIFLKDGQLEAILGDIERFMADEGEYVERCMPWHRGYLFHGPPGTGKTTLPRVLADKYGLDLYILPLGDLKGDTNLNNLVSAVRRKSILVIEDADVFASTRERDDEKERVSLGGLLNALDGLSTPHGLITIITTNHIESLDSALIRPGRVDRIEELSYLDDEQLKRMFAWFYKPHTLSFPDGMSAEGLDITPADVSEIFKSNFASPAHAAHGIAALIIEKRNAHASA